MLTIANFHFITDFLSTSLNMMVTQAKACLTFIVEIALKIIRELGEAYHANNQQNVPEKNREANVVDNKAVALQTVGVEKQPVIDWPQSKNPRLTCIAKHRLPPSIQNRRPPTRVVRNKEI